MVSLCKRYCRYCRKCIHISFLISSVFSIGLPQFVVSFYRSVAVRKLLSLGANMYFLFRKCMHYASHYMHCFTSYMHYANKFMHSLCLYVHCTCTMSTSTLTILVLQACCTVTTEYDIPSNFVRKSTASL